MKGREKKRASRSAHNRPQRLTYLFTCRAKIKAIRFAISDAGEIHKNNSVSIGPNFCTFFSLKSRWKNSTSHYNTSCSNPRPIDLLKLVYLLNLWIQRDFCKSVLARPPCNWRSYIKSHERLNYANFNESVVYSLMQLYEVERFYKTEISTTVDVTIIRYVLSLENRTWHK